MAGERANSLSTRNLLVIADDFGLCPGVNRAVVNLHQTGRVQGTSLLVNGAAAAEATALAKNFPELQVGLHLCLVEEKPVADPKLLPNLAPEGTLPSHAKDLAGLLWSRKIPEDEIAIELEAQLCWMLDHGLKPTHLDSHQHTHVLGPVAKITAELAQRFSIPRIRDLSITHGGFGPDRRLSYLEETGLKMLASVAKSSHLEPYSKTALFFGLLESGHLTLAALQEMKNLPWVGTAELMCHPGYDDPAYNNYLHWQYNWVGDWQALNSWEGMEK